MHPRQSRNAKRVGEGNAMKLKYWTLLGVFAGLFTTGASSFAYADETVTDWKGNKVTLQEGDVDSRGVKIHYYTVGEGPLLIISHGNGNYWFDWRNQISAFSKKYKVVVYDMRGYNKSDKITGIENNVDAKFEEDLKAVQEHFTQGPAIHIGHDQGGMVLWCYAMNYPDKVRLLIQMNAIHPRAFVRQLALNTEQAKASYYIEDMIVDTEKAYARSIAGLTTVRPNDPPEIQKMRADANMRTTEKGRIETVDWYRANFPGKPYTPDSRAFGSHGVEFPHVKAPTLVIAALGDRALTPGGYDQLGTWIDAEYQLVTLPVPNHSAQTELPDTINPIMANWLDVHDPSPKRLSKR